VSQELVHGVESAGVLFVRIGQQQRCTLPDQPVLESVY